jgi:uncharacterized membrane protein
MISRKFKTTLRRGEKNVSENGRWVSATLGGAFVYKGLGTRDSLAGGLLALVGGYLVYRGATGHCPVTERLGPSIPREGWAVSRDQGIHVERSVVVSKPPEELYRFWRKLDNLPRFMNHLERVATYPDGHSHWVAKAPLGQKVAWDAEIVGERKNELLSWRSLPDADVPNAGSVRFKPLEGGAATEVTVSLKYSPPAGILGATFARLFGEEPNQQIAEDLSRFKRLMESGEVASHATKTGLTTETTAGSKDEDEVAEASEESFPASDAPAWTGARSGGKKERK